MRNQTRRSPSNPGRFNWNNRLGKYVADDGTATATWLVYDADGTRVARIETGGDTTHYVGGIFEITNPAGTATSRSYYSFNGQTVGYRHRVTGSGERRFLLADHLGTNAVEVNETSGAVTEQYYLPFGDLRGSSSNGLGTDRTYTGQTADPSTGLMFYNARYYLPALRRFISADTIVPDPGNPQDLNRYTYVNNNPVNLTDPSGHEIQRGAEGGLPIEKIFHDPEGDGRYAYRIGSADAPNIIVLVPGSNTDQTNWASPRSVEGCLCRFGRRVGDGSGVLVVDG